VAESLPASTYYRSSRYSTRIRYLAYWWQAQLIESTSPREVLEVGIGPGVVAGVLRAAQIPTTTVDMNPNVHPDVVSDVRDLEQALDGAQFDVVLCARVLHHLEVGQLPAALRALAAVTGRVLILVVPRENLSLYVSLRTTGTDLNTVVVRLPLVMKRVIRRLLSTFLGREMPASGSWALGAGLAHDDFERMLGEHFRVSRRCSMHEDRSHEAWVLEPSTRAT
jgi:hypothetical protein